MYQPANAAAPSMHLQNTPTGQRAVPAGPKGTIISMLDVSLQRLEEIVDQETAALRGRKSIDLKEFNDRKSQALLELTRMLRSMPNGEANAEMAARVSSLKAKLVINQQALKTHLEAVREISTTLADAIRHADSDGTYTQAISAYSRHA